MGSTWEHSGAGVNGVTAISALRALHHLVALQYGRSPNVFPHDLQHAVAVVRACEQALQPTVHPQHVHLPKQQGIARTVAKSVVAGTVCGFAALPYRRSLADHRLR